MNENYEIEEYNVSGGKKYNTYIIKTTMKTNKGIYIYMENHFNINKKNVNEISFVETLEDIYVVENAKMVNIKRSQIIGYSKIYNEVENFVERLIEEEL